MRPRFWIYPCSSQIHCVSSFSCSRSGVGSGQRVLPSLEFSSTYFFLECSPSDASRSGGFYDFSGFTQFLFDTLTTALSGAEFGFWFWAIEILSPLFSFGNDDLLCRFDEDLWNWSFVFFETVKYWDLLIRSVWILFCFWWIYVLGFFSSWFLSFWLIG